jgi:hypothetical protein
VRGEKEEEPGREVYFTSLPSARDLALGKDFFLFLKFALPSARDLALGKDFLKILKYSLPSASWMTLGKESFTILCRVLYSWHSANHPLPSVICGHSANYFFIFPTKLFVVCSYTM